MAWYSHAASGHDVQAPARHWTDGCRSAGAGVTWRLSSDCSTSLWSGGETPGPNITNTWKNRPPSWNSTSSAFTPKHSNGPLGGPRSKRCGLGMNV